MNIKQVVNTGAFTAISLLIAVDLSIIFSAPAKAAATCQNSPRDQSIVNNGLISTPALSYGTNVYFGDNLGLPGSPITGACAINPTLVPFNVNDFSTSTPGPLSYQGLKNTYYTKSQYSGTTLDISGKKIRLSGSSEEVYDWTTNFTFGDPPGGSRLSDANDFVPSGGAAQKQAAVIFIDGNLYINKDLSYADNGSGNSAADDHGALLFVVKGNAYIDENVKTVEASIIAGNTICTGSHWDSSSGYTCPAPPNFAASQTLTVYGNFISLDPITGDNDVVLNRYVTTLGTPSEIVHSQPKYLVLLKDIFSQELMQQTENTSYGN